MKFIQISELLLPVKVKGELVCCLMLSVQSEFSIYSTTFRCLEM